MVENIISQLITFSKMWSVSVFSDRPPTHDPSSNSFNPSHLSFGVRRWFSQFNFWAKAERSSVTSSPVIHHLSLSSAHTLIEIQTQWNRKKCTTQGQPPTPSSPRALQSRVSEKGNVTGFCRGSVCLCPQSGSCDEDALFFSSAPNSRARFGTRSWINPRGWAEDSICFSCNAEATDETINILTRISNKCMHPVANRKKKSEMLNSTLTCEDFTKWKSVFSN